jgi:putative oxidoreductase
MTTMTQNQNRTATGDDRLRRGFTSGFALPSAGRISAALAVLRVIIGAVFVAHGAQKLFVFGFAGVTGAFEGMGVPLAGIAGPVVALLEFFGGLALIAGLFTRLTAVALGGVMLGALVLVHIPAGFFLPNGMEFVLALFGAVVAIALTGPGAFSLDAGLARRRAAA